MHLNLKINNKKRTAPTYREPGQDTPGTRGAVRQSRPASCNRTYITVFLSSNRGATIKFITKHLNINLLIILNANGQSFAALIYEIVPSIFMTSFSVTLFRCII